MKNLKTVGIKQLKNDLSGYLRDVRRGFRILVSDRSEIVAEIREPMEPSSAADRNPIIAAWLDAGLIRLPTSVKQPLPPSPLSGAAQAAGRLLDEERGER